MLLPIYFLSSAPEGKAKVLILWNHLMFKLLSLVGVW